MALNCSVDGSGWLRKMVLRPGPEPGYINGSDAMLDLCLKAPCSSTMALSSDNGFI